KRLGIESPLAPDLSLALGSSSVSLLELTRAFATFANMGQRPAPLFITKITDKYGNVLEENTPEAEEAISPQTAYIMTSLLESVIEDGTGWRAKALGRAVAGKTGTTNNTNDAWFLGYTPSLAAGAWVGYDGEQPLGRNETGARAALPIWLKFMEEATKGVAPENFPVPDGIEFARIDPSTGLLAEETTKDAVFEVFKSGTSPRISSAGRKNTREGKDFFLMDSGEEPDKKEEPKERARKTGSFPF
ncbi:MAG TPA: penicillin-binding transpeptidase domain-containing protein, partial [Thermodesulfobacteriota bacterium]|nr:penicillin-binding transpeptidase domain-containing protein [Thermodesulfobacteriota bacterium]